MSYSGDYGVTKLSIPNHSAPKCVLYVVVADYDRGNKREITKINLTTSLGTLGSVAIMSKMLY